MAKYIKLPIPVKIEPVTEARTIPTLEGSQEIKPGEYLVTGVKGELYAIPQEKFENYDPAPDKPGYFVKKQTVEVDAIQIDFPITIDRPGWVHSGKPGDYLLYAGQNDQYVCDQEVFKQTYRAVE